MDEKRVVDYFVVAGLPDKLQPIEELSCEAIIKSSHKQDPIIDISVINKSEGETCPPKFKLVEFTPTGFPANLNHGSLLSPEMYLCYRRGRDKPPLTDIGILYEGKERVMSGCEVIHTTPQGRPANVNNSNSNRSYVTIRRAEESAASDTLAVTDVCIILANKGETPPHAFCQINKNLNKGMVGSAVFLCYKKSMAKANTLAYKPCVLARYPYEDDETFALPDRVAMFCLPLGAAIEAWPARAQHPLPVFSTFVLTGAGGEKVYGSAVTFYEEYPSDKLTEEQKTELRINPSPQNSNEEKNVHANKCICLLSRWPFFDTCKKFLSYLYRISISGPHSLPIERLISHFLTEVPFPSPQRPRILVQFSHEAISLAQPEDSPLPLSGASFITLLRNLGPEDCMNLLLYALMEHKLLIHSLRPAVLTSVAEAVAAMIFPFHWQCPYIPLCPISLSAVLNAPCPFIVGVDSRYFDMYDPPPDVTCVDLDTNTISQRAVNWKFLPKKPVKVLRQTLERLFEKLCQEPSQPGTPEDMTFDMGHIDHDFRRRKREIALELVIQEAFLRFMASLLKGYKQYLLPITRAPTNEATDASKLFDMQGFLKSRDKAYHKFFNSMMKTQTFIRFIEERSFVTDKDACLAFFDECTEKVDENKDETRLIEVDDSSKSERTVFITPPDPAGLPPDATYSYNGFPDLQPNLFLDKTRAPLHGVKNTPTPSSPMTRRTKQEIRSAQKIAQKHIRTPELWAKCLLSHCYSLWFIHLPAYVKNVHSKTKAMRVAFDVLVKMQAAKLDIPDEVCYRVLLQLCGVYQQPVLAVKVLFEMKRNGIHPNAITYGFYNKAVLESKWPSSETNAYLLWNKLRNVIMGVAQFRRAALNARRRSLSLYSNSESDIDRISRASTDSCMDDLSADKVDAISGGASDRGYSSMTLEDAKQISSIIGSQELSEADLNKLKNGGRVKMTSPPRKTVKAKHKDKPAGQNHFQSIDPNADEVLCARVGSIVRKTAGNNENGNTFRGSAAGLLMTSNNTLDESVFGDLSELSISHSLHSNSPNDALRKRHKSAGAEPASKGQETVDVLQSLKQNIDSADGNVNMNNKNKTLHIDGVTLSSASTDDNEIHQGASSTPVLSDTVKETNGSGSITVSAGKVNANEQISESTVNSGVNEKSTHTVSADPLVAVAQTAVPPGVLPLKSDPLGAASATSDPLGILSASGENSDSQGIDASQTDSAISLASASSTASSNQSKTSPASPTHSLRTPVTENDPLGLFTNLLIPVSTDSASTTLTSSQTSQLNNTGLLLNLTSPGGSGESDSQTTTPTPASVTSPAKSMSSRRNLFIDMEPFSGLLTRTRDSPAKKKAATLPNKLTNGKDSGSLPRVDSSSSDCGSPEAWSPLSASSSSQRIGGVSKSQEDILSDDNSMKTSTPVRRLVARSESFHNALKSAASVFATKFSEIKQQVAVISTPSKTDSNQSLQKTLNETERLLSEEEEDFLRGANERSGRSRPSDDVMDTYSLDGYLSGRRPSNTLSNMPQSQSAIDHLAPLRQLDAISQKTSSSTQSIPQAFFNVAMEVEICSLSRCTSCNALLYDEEIMAGWTADDSNLNTTCQFCAYKVVPMLQVVIKDWRQQNKPMMMTPSQSSESMQSIHSMPNNHHSRPPNHRPLSANMSMTSLSSTENILHEDTPESPNPQIENGPATAITPKPEVTGPEVISQPEVTETEVTPKPEVTGTEVISQPEVTAETAITPKPELTETEVTPKPEGTVEAETGKLIDFSPPASPTSVDESKTNFTESSQPSAELRAKFASSPCQSVDSDQNADGEVTSLGSDIKEGSGNMTKAASPTVEVQSHPYLSPLVLRKEMENIMEQEGEMCLTKAEFVDEHPIIFWNLMWYFKRLGFSSHLPGFILTAKSTNKGNQVPPKFWSSADSRHVLVRALWDNVRLHEQKGQLMYLNWQTSPSQSDSLNALNAESQTFSKSVMQHVISNIMLNDVVTPIRRLMSERRKLKRSGKSRCHSIYREILFLSMAALGRDNIDHDAFDREYRDAFNNLSHKEVRQVHIDDRPPNAAVIWTRRVFEGLEF